MLPVPTSKREPREQVVRHVYVGEGGKAIVTGAVNYLAGGADEKANEQSHAAAREAGGSSSLPSEDSEGRRVSSPGGQR